MTNGVKYLILTIVFLGILKLLQVTAFDGKKYESLKKQRENKMLSKSMSKTALKKPVPPASMKSEVQAAKSKSSDYSRGKATKLDQLKETYLQPLRDELPPDGLRKDIFIRYYRHDKDGIGVYKLEEMGYYIHQKPATETAGLGSNIIYYGDEVPLQDIQIVALTLLEEGIPLKSIEHTKFEWKSSAIEIGADISLQEKPTVSTQYILDFDKQYLGNR
ncbi:MAG: hypothetical protein AAF616_04500 [Bacteroidota bacterium]